MMDWLKRGDNARTGWAFPVILFLVLLYAFGAAHWLAVCANESFTGLAHFDTGDWRLAMRYQDIIREALTDLKMPYFMSLPHYTDRFFGLPETPLMPQMLLVPWLSDPVFNTFQLLLLYSCCFAGLLVIRRQYQLGYLAFTFLFLLFNFNGYLVSRVAAGHFMWYGYFFLPWFLLFVLRLAECENKILPVLLSALVLFVILLQGSFHLYVWCIMFLILLAIIQVRLIPPIIAVIVLSAFLGAFRLLPAAVSLDPAALEFKSGYNSLSCFLDALTRAQPMKWKDELGFYGGLYWWEIDIFVGISGVALLGYFGIVRGFLSRKEPGYPSGFTAMGLAGLVMAIFSFGNITRLFIFLHVPMLASQRVATRYMVIPLTVLIVLSALHMESFLRSRKSFSAAAMAIGLLLFTLAWQLVDHSHLWRVTIADELFKPWNWYPESVTIIPPDYTQPGAGIYVAMVWLGILISFISLCLVCGGALRCAKKTGGVL